MKTFRAPILALILALPLAGLLAGCSWSAKEDLEILSTDQDSITIRAGSSATPDKVAILYCQGMRKLMVPKGADTIDAYQKTYHYACL
jgi:hypothetical protein